MAIILRNSERKGLVHGGGYFNSHQSHDNLGMMTPCDLGTVFVINIEKRGGLNCFLNVIFANNISGLGQKFLVAQVLLTHPFASFSVTSEPRKSNYSRAGKTVFGR